MVLIIAFQKHDVSERVFSSIIRAKVKLHFMVLIIAIKNHDVSERVFTSIIRAKVKLHFYGPHNCL